MKDRKGFGNRIKEIREFRNLTIEKAAELCDCSESTWKQYERGERLPSLPKLKNICLILKVKPEYLFGSELDTLQKDLSEVEQLKLKIEQLSPDDIIVMKAAVEKRLELSSKKTVY
ncbi:MAG: helix-turn-helix domain-containing protein [Lachnospiraceae bacterium]|jgi:transcriptional regulator with XRE-family HTH domain